MEYIKLGEIAKIVAGSTAPKENQFNDSTGLPFIRAGHLEALCNNYDLNRLPRVDESNKDIKKQVRVPKNTIVFAKSGMSCMKARVYQTTEESYIVNHLAGIICSEKVNPSYLKYYFMINKPNRLVIDESYPSIRLSDISNMNIYIPNLEIQLKIANILDKANNLIDKRKEQIESLDELVKSRFIEMFGNPSLNPKGWKVEELSKSLVNIENGKSFVCENYNREGSYPAILKLSAVTYGVYNSFENKALIDKESFVEKTEVKAGDLLFTRKNTPELVGMSAYVYETTPNLMMPDLIFRLNANERCNKIYLWKLINHDSFREKIKALSNGSAKSMSNISKERLMNLKIPVPPIELQNQFADFVKQVDKLKFEMEKSLKELEDNFNSLMQKAFKGELF